MDVREIPPAEGGGARANKPFLSFVGAKAKNSKFSKLFSVFNQNKHNQPKIK